MPKASAAKATCPRPEHADSRVRLDGTYGKPGHRRQRYKCLPPGGEKAHVFTELLPREEAWRGACEECERGLLRREGPQAPRKYRFVARGIAEALCAVGGGDTYMRASQIARRRARRFPVDPQSGVVRNSDHGQLVADWVEIFAPVVFEPNRPRAWPERGSLLIDQLPFRTRALNRRGEPVRGGRSAFDVLLAVGYDRGRPRLFRAEAFVNSQAKSWETFLSALPGKPCRVVLDAHRGMLAGCEKVWPGADLHFCEWHLKRALERLIAKEAERQADLEPLKDGVLSAFADLSSWRLFARKVHAHGNKGLTEWLLENDPIIERQIAERRLTRRADMPRTTGALEQICRPIKETLHPRQHVLGNRERLNRLLMLIQLHVNGQDDHRAYAKAIRAWLEANGGRPRGRRRAIADPRNIPSLRY